MFMVMNPSLETQPSIRRLLEHYPDMPSFLVFESPFQLLIAVILSAQCTDAMVNKVSQVLFARYPDPQALAAASLEDLERIVHPTGFYRAKARNIQRCAQSLVDLHQGVVPDTMTALTEAGGSGTEDRQRDPRAGLRQSCHYCGYPLWACGAPTGANEGQGCRQSGEGIGPVGESGKPLPFFYGGQPPWPGPLPRPET
jgi:hypothetical protein